MQVLRSMAWIFILGVAACGSSTPAPPPVDSGFDHPSGSSDAAASDAVSPPDNNGQTYPCFPPPNDAGTDGSDASQPVTCVVGQTYCRATRPRDSAGALAQCMDVPANCASSPTCACIMPTPSVSCSCAEPGGLVVLTCDRI